MERSQKTEELKDIIYLEQLIKNIKRQTYKINADVCKEFYKHPVFNEPAKYHGSSFDNFESYTTELQNIVNKLKNYNGGTVSLLSNITGCGKTHLAIAAAREYYRNLIYKWIDENADRDFGYKDYAKEDFDNYIKKKVPKFFSEKETYSLKYGNIEFNFYINTKGLIIIDDMFAGKQNETAEAAMYEIINTRTNNNLPTIITSNLTLKQMSEGIDRIASRLQGDYCYQIVSGKDMRGRG